VEIEALAAPGAVSLERLLGLCPRAGHGQKSLGCLAQSSPGGHVAVAVASARDDLRVSCSCA